MEAAFFDLDKTVIAKASLVAFGRPLYDAGMISRAVIARALWSNFLFQRLGADEERMRKFRHSALRITRGWDQALVSAIVRDTLVEVIEPIVYAEALDLIQEHRDAGRRVFLVSASPEEIVAPLAQFLGVDEAIASRAELDGEGRYTGNVEFWSYGPYKVEAITSAAERQGIDLERSYAYSDSITDAPMLALVGFPVAVNPDRELARLARERGWEVRWFQQGVPLRERVNMPRPGKALTVAGSAAVAVGAGALLLWWWGNLRRVRVPWPPPNRNRGQVLVDQLGAVMLDLTARRSWSNRRPTPPPLRRDRLRWRPEARAATRRAPPRRRRGGRSARRPAASSPRRRRG